MKRLLPVILLSSISFFGFGQQFTLEFDSMTISGVPSQTEMVCYNFIRNTTSDTLVIRWVRIEKSFPTGWKSQICDLNACYLFSISTQIFNLLPNDTSNLDIHFWPENVSGEGEIELLTYIEGDSAATVQSSHYKGTAAPVGINGIANDFDVTVKPNPVQDVFSLNGIENLKDVKFQIFDIIGNMVNVEIDITQPYINVSDLPKGFYFLQLSSGEVSYIKTVRFEKL